MLLDVHLMDNNEGVHFHHITLARKKEWLQKLRRDEDEMFKVCCSVLVI